MSARGHAEHAPVGGGLFTPVTFFCVVLMILAAAVLAVRFVHGLGAVTHLSDGYPWGIWVVADVVIGSALACGGFAVAALVYIFNKGEYHPLIRPALLASLLGYTLAGVGVLFDLGRYWNFYHIFLPGYASPNSVMFEVAVCISLYIVVLWIEFSPAVLEKFGLADAKKKLMGMMYLFIGLGMVLPMMHQSSLGSLLIVFGHQIHPLWQTMLLPLIYLMTAVLIGYAIVLFESCVAAAGYRRSIEVHLLNPLAKVMLGVLAAYLVIRFGDLVVRGALGSAFAANLQAFFFWLETLCFAAPFYLLGSEAKRRKPANLFLGGLYLLLGGILLRLNSFLIGYMPGENWSYFPSTGELVVTLGVFALKILAYIVITRRFPVLPREARATAH
ncbi:MAG: Ni/Fe-hydrogenase cytochrome b subunit [Rhodocyclaceae bacterium]|jgi:Ni/Fe-hydrogenase subunit HybB-like protein|nr:Ni/Fe-hydrogenase cytochrome b subunit [Rhodocyclaceae bacterium]MCL4757068.1 Ni/Fe-hydrogenase cytochrome b subunit [Rhodocyclaceae bacterium]